MEEIRALRAEAEAHDTDYVEEGMALTDGLTLGRSDVLKRHASA
jgi:hypothetical protein